MKIVPVSVIIPFYEGDVSIERAVSSVVLQTVRPKELIIVNDGGGYRAYHSLRTIQNCYGDWIKVIDLESNLGPAVARNIGWEAAKGKFIAFLDADDAWHPKKIEIQYAWMEEHMDIVLTSHRYSVARGRNPDFPIIDRWNARPIRGHSLLLSNSIPTPSAMLQRNVQFRFDPSKRSSEDYLLWLEIVLSGYSAWLLDIPLVQLFKAPYGEGGLSGCMWQMERGEIDTYRKLYKKGLLSGFSYWLLIGLSLTKYLRRVFLRKHHNHR